MVNRIKNCRVCRSESIEVILDLGIQALSGVFPKNTDPDPQSGPLEIGLCNICGLVQLMHNYPSELMYGDNYGYRSGLNSSMVRHLQNKALNIYNKYTKGSNSVILDIGSNDGTLLNTLCGTGAKLIGIDPTSSKFAEFYEDNVIRIPSFFSSGLFNEISLPADIIFSIAMFYDLEDPVEFVTQISESLKDDGVWHFEQSYLVSMLDTNSFDTICHEHVEYYSFTVIENILAKAGMKVIDVELNNTNGGSIAITAAKFDSSHSESFYVDWIRRYERVKLVDLNASLNAFTQRVNLQRQIIRDLVLKAKDRGMEVWGVGASTKGNTLLQYCDLNSELITAVSDVNPFKFDRFTPGTKIPIKPEKDMLEAMPEIAIVLPWHFKSTIVSGNQEFLVRGGKLIFPLPNIEIVNY